ncbi:MAG: hypothetical protein AAB564_03025, partial [Patescibacteria group bacterium]
MARKSLGKILHNGKYYLSLNLAASQCGYHKEYLRQLIRAGKLNGERINDLWFIEEEIFAKFRKENVYFNNNYQSNNTNAQNDELFQEIRNIKNELAKVKSTAVKTLAVLLIVSAAGFFVLKNPESIYANFRDFRNFS